MPSALAGLPVSEIGTADVLRVLIADLEDEDGDGEPRAFARRVGSRLCEGAALPHRREPRGLAWQLKMILAAPDQAGARRPSSRHALCRSSCFHDDVTRHRWRNCPCLGIRRHHGVRRAGELSALVGMKSTWMPRCGQCRLAACQRRMGDLVFRASEMAGLYPAACSTSCFSASASTIPRTACGQPFGTGARRKPSSSVPSMTHRSIKIAKNPLRERALPGLRGSFYLQANA